MTVKINFGASAKQPSWDDRERDRSKISIDWDAITNARHERIRWEIAQGLEPAERSELPEYQEQPAPKAPVKKRFFNGGKINTDGAPRKFDHAAIVNRYIAGESGTAIAKDIGANKATVYGILRQYKIERREYNGGANQFTTQ